MLRFFQSKRNRDMVGFFAGGLVALVTAGWAVFTYLLPSPTSADKAQQNPQASCSLIAGGSITAQTIDLNCGPTPDEIKQIVSATLSGAQIVTMVQNVHSDENRYQEQINVLAEKLNLVSKDVQGILLALNQTALPTDQAVKEFASIAASYAAIKSQSQQISEAGSLTQTDSHAILSALQTGDLGLARTLLAVAEQNLSKAPALANDASRKNECDGGSLPYGPIQNATFAQSQITNENINDFNDNWPSINLANLNYRDPDNPFLILINTRYRAFVPATPDAQYFTFSIPDQRGKAELQIRSTEVIHPRVLITDAITGATVLKGVGQNFDAADFVPSATRYNLTISFDSSNEAKNYCFGVTTIDTGYAPQGFDPD